MRQISSLLDSSSSSLSLQQHPTNAFWSLKECLGQSLMKLLFRFYYTDEHITNNNHVYQVKMMSEDEAMITLFKKDFIIEDFVDDMQTPLLSNAKSSKFNNVDTIPFNIDETSKLADGSSKGNGSNRDGEGNSKAIESDRGDSGSGNV
ncbi:hypothetical protein Tco_0040626 [Tanacetum coccineum]